MAKKKNEGNAKAIEIAAEENATPKAKSRKKAEIDGTKSKEKEKKEELYGDESIDKVSDDGSKNTAENPVKKKRTRAKKNEGRLFAEVPDADEIDKLTPIFEMSEDGSSDEGEDDISFLPHADPDPSLIAYDSDDIEDTHESAEENAKYQAFLADYKLVMADVLNSTGSANTSKTPELEIDDLVITDEDEDEVIYDEDEPVTDDEWKTISQAMNIEGKAYGLGEVADAAATSDEEDDSLLSCEDDEDTERESIGEEKEDDKAIEATDEVDEELTEATDEANESQASDEVDEELADVTDEADESQASDEVDEELAEATDEAVNTNILKDDTQPDGSEDEIDGNTETGTEKTDGGEDLAADATAEATDTDEVDSASLSFDREVEPVDLLTTADIWSYSTSHVENTEDTEAQLEEEEPIEADVYEYADDYPDDEEYEDAAQLQMDLGEQKKVPENDEKPGYNPEKPRFIDTVFETVELIAFTFIAVMVITGFFFRHSVVDGGSMEKTLSDGDILIISDFLYEPKRGDIVVFEDYKVSGDAALIKRIIGIEGDTVRIDREGNVYVNGEPLLEDYVYESYKHAYNEGEWVVGKGEIFVLGDHRNNSRDSEDFGPVNADSILGRVLFRFYPFDSFGAVD